LKPYVKCYLRPDATKSTKKKVQALFNGAYPIFTETVYFYINLSILKLFKENNLDNKMEYEITSNDLQNRILEVSVLNNKLNKEKIGSVEIKLFDINWNDDFIRWYDLR
jgi:hypothetical protein